jgi:hypothetical protein
MLLTKYRLEACEKAAIGARALLASSLALYVVFVGASSLATPTAKSIPIKSNYHVLDLSWTGVNHGWALVEVPCGVAQCEELLVSTDGIHWSSAGPVPARSPCWSGYKYCASKVRFANSHVGYVFDPDLLMTTDAGRSWKRLAGATLALEIANGQVVRITGPTDHCFPRCPLRIEISDVGTTSWRTVLAHLPGTADHPSLQRNGNRIYAALTGNTAGGADYPSPISISDDGGTHWTNDADPCGGTTSMFVGMSAAPSRQLVVQCYVRGGVTPANSLFVSGDSGESWAGPYPWSAAVDEYGAAGVAVSSSGIIVRVTGKQLRSFVYTDVVIEVSTNHGRTWQQKADLRTALSWPVWVGFEDASTARVMVSDVLWTSSDGGQSWTKSRFD